MTELTEFGKLNLRLEKLEANSHEPVDFTDLFENVNERLGALEHQLEGDESNDSLVEHGSGYGPDIGLARRVFILEGQMNSLEERLAEVSFLLERITGEVPAGPARNTVQQVSDLLARRL